MPIILADGEYIYQVSLDTCPRHCVVVVVKHSAPYVRRIFLLFNKIFHKGWGEIAIAISTAIQIVKGKRELNQNVK